MKQESYFRSYSFPRVKSLSVGRSVSSRGVEVVVEAAQGGSLGEPGKDDALGGQGTGHGGRRHRDAEAGDGEGEDGDSDGPGNCRDEEGLRGRSWGGGDQSQETAGQHVLKQGAAISLQWKTYFF